MYNSVIQAFGNDFLSAFGFESKRIVEHIPSEIKTIRNEKIMVEDLFRYEDGTLLQIVCHPRAEINERDLWEFVINYMAIYDEYEQNIRAILVLPPTIQDAEIPMDRGSIYYNPEVLWLSRWNADEISGEINDKIQQNGELMNEELSLLTMLPFMNTKGSRLQTAVEAVKIANQVDKGKRNLVIKLMKSMTRKLLSGDDYDQVVQAFERA
ncbi:hypothetical protein HN020_02730 [Brevibacillus borstelensis]|uniref:hypothetical protein n=1 Tax=Brevibacillus borstelensis TaxID=45462 RepID=UPI00148F6A2D|nr:hypothetical protein [Brevibacillus borstelensis]NOU53718.1 hypothetical protein [Brevibacillus borstelensis]